MKRATAKAIAKTILLSALYLVIIAAILVFIGEPLNASGWWIKLPAMAVIYASIKICDWIERPSR